MSSLLNNCAIFEIRGKRELVVFAILLYLIAQLELDGVYDLVGVETRLDYACIGRLGLAVLY